MSNREGYLRLSKRSSIAGSSNVPQTGGSFQDSGCPSGKEQNSFRRGRGVPNLDLEKGGWGDGHVKDEPYGSGAQVFGNAEPQEGGLRARGGGGCVSGR